MNKSEMIAKALQYKRQLDEQQEKQVWDKINELRKVDIVKTAKEHANAEELTKEMSDSEKAEFEEQIAEVADSYSNVLDIIATYFEDEETRDKIIDELKRRI